MGTKVTSRIEGSTAWILLDGADRLNAIGTQTYTDLVAAIHEQFDSIGIELTPDYWPIIEARTDHAKNNPELA